MRKKPAGDIQCTCTYLFFYIQIETLLSNTHPTTCRLWFTSLYDTTYMYMQFESTRYLLETGDIPGSCVSTVPWYFVMCASPFCWKSQMLTHTPTHQGFFTGGGLGGSPPVGKNLVNPPPSGTRPHFPTRACPPTQHLSPKFFAILVHFCTDFDYF